MPKGPSPTLYASEKVPLAVKRQLQLQAINEREHFIDQVQVDIHIGADLGFDVGLEALFLRVLNAGMQCQKGLQICF